MAPFLHGRQMVKELSSTIRSLLSLSKKEESTSDGKFQKIDVHRKMYDLERNGQIGRGGTFATANRQADDVDDTIPLHAIKVTDRVDVHSK